MKRWCGIDPGLTGFCVAIFSYKSIEDWLFISTSSKLDLQERIEMILIWLRIFLKKHNIHQVKMEIPVYGANANAFFMQVSLYQAILDMCQRIKPPVWVSEVRPTQAKMHLEKGSIKKDRIKEIFERRFAMSTYNLTKPVREGLLDALMIGMYQEDLNRFCFETWKDIEGYEEEYQVSTLGRIRSKDRIDSADRNLSGKIIKLLPHGKTGYLKIGLHQNGKQNTVLVHRLVAKAFVANPKQYVEVNHKNGDKKDNRAENLEWCSRSHNVRHAYQKLGRKPKPQRGEKHGRAKLNWNKVAAIRAAHPRKTMGELAREYGVSRSTIAKIVHYEAWKIGDLQ